MRTDISGSGTSQKHFKRPRRSSTDASETDMLSFLPNKLITGSTPSKAHLIQATSKMGASRNYRQLLPNQLKDPQPLASRSPDMPPPVLIEVGPASSEHLSRTHSNFSAHVPKSEDMVVPEMPELAGITPDKLKPYLNVQESDNEDIDELMSSQSTISHFSQDGRTPISAINLAELTTIVPIPQEISEHRIGSPGAQPVDSHAHGSLCEVPIVISNTNADSPDAGSDSEIMRKVPDVSQLPDTPACILFRIFRAMS